jgi:hypothetical protein
MIMVGWPTNSLLSGEHQQTELLPKEAPPLVVGEPDGGQAEVLEAEGNVAVQEAREVAELHR